MVVEKVAVVTPLVVLSVPVPSVGRAVLERDRAGGRAGAGAETATVAVKVTDWPIDRGGRARPRGSSSSCPATTLRQGRRGAGQIVGVAAIDGGDGV